MKAVNVANLQKLKKFLQKQKIKRIDAYRMQVCRGDLNQQSLDVGREAPVLIKDQQGQFMVVCEDSNGRQYLKPFRLLSNSAETNLEMHAVQKDILVPAISQAQQASTPAIQDKDKKSLNNAEEQDEEAVDKDDPHEEAKDDKQKSEAGGSMNGDQANAPAGTTITQQEILVKVDNIQINDKTEEVINKLRKINILYQRQRDLTKYRDELQQIKMTELARVGHGADNFKDKACRKTTQRLKLCQKLHKTGQQSDIRELAKPAMKDLREQIKQVEQSLTSSGPNPQQLMQHSQQLAAAGIPWQFMLYQQQQQIYAKSRQNSNSYFM